MRKSNLGFATKDSILISDRAYSALLRNNIRSVEKVVELTEADLLAINGIGRKTGCEIKKALAEVGLELKRCENKDGADRKILFRNFGYKERPGYKGIRRAIEKKNYRAQLLTFIHKYHRLKGAYAQLLGELREFEYAQEFLGKISRMLKFRYKIWLIEDALVEVLGIIDRTAKLTVVPKDGEIHFGLTIKKTDLLATPGNCMANRKRIVCERITDNAMYAMNRLEMPWVKKNTKSSSEQVSKMRSSRAS